MKWLKQLFCKHDTQYDFEGKWVRIRCLKCEKCKYGFRGNFREYLKEIL